MPLRTTSLLGRRAIVSIVLIALALAQTFGLVHRIAHSPLAAHANAPISAQASPAAGWLKALFAGHGTEQGCGLYDQLSHADLLQVDSPAVAYARPVEVCVPARPVWQFAAESTRPRARGPPPAI